MTVDRSPDPVSIDVAEEPSPRQRSHLLVRILLGLGAAAFIAFWVWALFLIDKTSVNKIDDRAWAARGEEICAPVKTALRELDLKASPDIARRAELVQQSTDMLSGMLDDLEAVRPTDDKGRAIVPDWIRDYRILLTNRYEYAAQLKAGDDGPFFETAVEGVPITERLGTFAGDNEMPSCAPPIAGVL